MQVTLSEASARHRLNRLANHTVEKRHLRCFQTLGMCRFEQHWHWTQSWWEMNKGFERPNWSAAQAFLKYLGNIGKLPKVMNAFCFHSPQLYSYGCILLMLNAPIKPPETTPFFLQITPSFPPLIDAAALLSKTAQSPAADASITGRVLRIVLARRPGAPRRSILNAEEVIKWCNTWGPGVAPAIMGSLKQAWKGRRRRSTGSGSAVRGLSEEPEEGVLGLLPHPDRRLPIVGAQCVSYDFEDLALSAALMMQTDVLVGVHGAAMMNAIFMPLGASAIEVRPYGFVGSWPNHYLRRMLTMTDHNSSVFWYGINIGSEANSAPGREEREGSGKPYNWQRDRHVRVDTAVLGRLFSRIAEVDGDAARYAKVAEAWGHYTYDNGTVPTDIVE